MCLIRPILPICSPDGQAVHDKYVCPLYQAEPEVTAIPVSSIQIQYQLSTNVELVVFFVEQRCQDTIERGMIDKSDLVFQHDFSNNLFCLDINFLAHINCDLKQIDYYVSLPLCVSHYYNRIIIHNFRDN